ncbi:hypothetical protein V6768_12525 [Tistrella mobilis]
MSEVTRMLADLLRRAARDTALRDRLKADPAAVLAEAGLDVPDGCEVVVLEDRRDRMHLVLPSPLMAYDDIDQAADVGGDVVTVGDAAFAAGLFPRTDSSR